MALRLFGLISDTHGHPHPRAFQALHGVEAILHAGDVEKEDSLRDLEALAPVFAVAGNCDIPSARLPSIRAETMPFGLAIIAHGHRSSAPAEAESLARLLGARRPRLILHGHTHRREARWIGDVFVVNPGPCSAKSRRGDPPGAAILRWDDAADSLSVEWSIFA